MIFFELVDQVLRHRSRERRTTHQHHHAARIPREIHCRLSGAIRAADDKHVLIFTRNRFSHRGAVVDPRTGETFNAGRIEFAPLHSRRDQQRVTTELCSVGEFEQTIWSFQTYRSCFGGEYLDAETSCLDHRAARQIAATEPARKAEIVFDAARHSGLPAGRFAFDHHGS